MFELAAAGTGVSRSTCDVDIKRPYISLSYPQRLDMTPIVFSYKWMLNQLARIAHLQNENHR